MKKETLYSILTALLLIGALIFATCNKEKSNTVSKGQKTERGMLLANKHSKI